MMRRLFKLLTLISLAVFVCAILLWLTSYTRLVRTTQLHASVRWEVLLYRGLIQIDNNPQLQIDQVQRMAGYRRLLDQGNALAVQMDQTLAGIVDKSPVERDKARANFTRLQ